MYQERRPSGIGRLIVRIFLIIVLIFVIVGVFPTKSFVKNLINNKLGVSANQVFNNNINTLKSAALSYYSGERLPEKTDRMTLKSMKEKELITDVTDSNGKRCDVNKSYVKAIKVNDEYKLEIKLVCRDKQDTIVSYFGLYDYCTNDVCAKKKLADNFEDNKNASNQEGTSDIECLYAKDSGGYWNYGNWSGWTANYIESSNTREVQTKTDKVQVGTIQEKSGTRVITQNPKKVTGTKNGQTFVVYVCPLDFDNGGSYNVAITCKKTVDNYINKPTYRDVTYYRYRNKNYIKIDADSKWSNCNDNDLINRGYKKTGQTR